MNYHTAKGATEDLVHSDAIKQILLHNLTFITCSAVQKNPQSPLEFLPICSNNFSYMYFIFILEGLYKALC